MITKTVKRSFIVVFHNKYQFFSKLLYCYQWQKSSSCTQKELWNNVTFSLANCLFRPLILRLNCHFSVLSSQTRLELGNFPKHLQLSCWWFLIPFRFPVFERNSLPVLRYHQCDIHCRAGVNWMGSGLEESRFSRPSIIVLKMCTKKGV